MAIVAKRYAESLINIAVSNNKVSEYEDQLELLMEVVSTKDLKDVLEYPGLNLSKKKELISNILFGDKNKSESKILQFFINIMEKFKHKDLTHIDQNIINFYMLLLDNGRQNNFREIVKEYKVLADEYKNVLNIEIISAMELEELQISRIKDKMSEKYNAKNIQVKLLIDPEVLGGVKVKIGDTVIDGTIKTKLDNMNKLIRQGTN